MSATKFKTQAIEDNAITTPKIADAQVTQAKLAAGVGGNTDHSFRIRKSATQSVPASTTTNITFDTEEFDTDNLHDNAVNNDRVTITLTSAGKWSIDAAIDFFGSALGQRILLITKNGGNIAAMTDQPNNANQNAQAVSTLIDLAAGDILRMAVYHDGAGTQNVGAGGFGPTILAGIRVAT